MKMGMPSSLRDRGTGFFFFSGGKAATTCSRPLTSIYNAKVKNVWRYIFTPPYVFMV
jgi:hypothetical protein